PGACVLKPCLERVQLLLTADERYRAGHGVRGTFAIADGAPSSGLSISSNPAPPPAHPSRYTTRMDNSRLVYSTDGGRVRYPEERVPARPGRALKPPPGFPNDGVVRVMRERG